MLSMRCFPINSKEKVDSLIQILSDDNYSLDQVLESQIASIIPDKEICYYFHIVYKKVMHYVKKRESPNYKNSWFDFVEYAKSVIELRVHWKNTDPLLHAIINECIDNDSLRFENGVLSRSRVFKMIEKKTLEVYSNFHSIETVNFFLHDLIVYDLYLSQLLMSKISYRITNISVRVYFNERLEKRIKGTKGDEFGFFENHKSETKVKLYLIDFIKEIIARKKSKLIIKDKKLEDFLYGHLNDEGALRIEKYNLKNYFGSSTYAISTPMCKQNKKY